MLRTGGSFARVITGDLEPYDTKVQLEAVGDRTFSVELAPFACADRGDLPGRLRRGERVEEMHQLSLHDEGFEVLFDSVHGLFAHTCMISDGPDSEGTSTHLTAAAACRVSGSRVTLEQAGAQRVAETCSAVETRRYGPTILLVLLTFPATATLPATNLQLGLCSVAQGQSGPIDATTLSNCAVFQGLLTATYGEDGTRSGVINGSIDVVEVTATDVHLSLDVTFADQRKVVGQLRPSIIKDLR